MACITTYYLQDGFRLKQQRTDIAYRGAHSANWVQQDKRTIYILPKYIVYLFKYFISGALIQNLGEVCAI